MSNTTVPLIEYVEGRRSIVGTVTVHSDGTIIGSVAPQEAQDVIRRFIQEPMDIAIVPRSRRS